jgi:eukaryotic-like serine/threonine-protein kinase
MQGSAERSALPSRLGQYEVLREIGRGGMAVLYEARHVLLGLRVVVKRPSPSLSKDDVVYSRFRNEALYAARIRHRNVIRIHDYGVESDAPYLVMEHLDGVPLSTVLALEGPLPVRRAVDLFLGLLAGTSAVHSAGITHRDLKPHNIFVQRGADGGEEAVVIDFGVAKCDLERNLDEPGSAPLTSSGATVGTAAYMAPEQILGAEGVGPPADQYSLAVTLYECLTGKLPFSGASRYEMMHAALNARPHAPSEHRADVPAALDHIVLRAMRREPEKRFPSVHAMGEALAPFASENAALGWRADVARMRALDGLDASAGDTESGAGALVRSRSLIPAARPTRRLLAVTALVAVTFGACSTALFAHGLRRASAEVVPARAPEAATPICEPPAPSTGLAIPLEETSAASVSGVSASIATPAPPRRTPAVARPPRGTNGAPILE